MHSFEAPSGMYIHHDGIVSGSTVKVNIPKGRITDEFTDPSGVSFVTADLEADDLISFVIDRHLHGRLESALEDIDLVRVAESIFDLLEGFRHKV